MFLILIIYCSTTHWLYPTCHAKCLLNGILVEWMWWRERLRDLETDKTSSRPPKEHQIFSELSPPILTSLFPSRHRGDEYTCDVCGRDGEYRYGVYHCVKCFAQGRPQLDTAIRDTWRSGRFFKCFCSWLFLPRKFRSWTKKHVVYITSWYKLWTLWWQFIALNSVKFKELCFSPWKRPRRTSVWCLSILWWSKRGDWKGQAVQGWQKWWQGEEVNKKLTASSWHVWDLKTFWRVCEM